MLTKPDINYTVEFEAEGGKDKFVISPYSLVVTAKNFRKTYGEADPSFTEGFEGAYGEIINVTYTREGGDNGGDLQLYKRQPYRRKHQLCRQLRGGRRKKQIYY